MIQLKNVNYHYASDENQLSLHDINLEISEGEVVVLCGESGCGKTTLIRLLNGLIPHFYEGELTGTVLVNGKEPSHQTIQEVSETVGSVFQNPRSQFFSTNTTSELAFGCENAGIDREIIFERIQEINHNLKFSNLLNRDIFSLSGGEKQKIACGSVSVNDDEIYVLDEPSSNLDLKAIEDLKQQLAYWKRQGKTIVVAEHRLYYLKELADRVIFIKDGEIAQEFASRDLDELSTTYLNNLGLRSISMSEILAENEEKVAVQDAIQLTDFSFAYKKQPTEALSIKEAAIPKGSVTAIVGLNGAGKSTFARCFCGLEKRCKGTVVAEDTNYDNKKRLFKSYVVMQDVNHQLFTESVLDEILLSMAEKDEEKAKSYLRQLNIEEFSERHPLSLSGGQKQRVAIASALASNSDWIFFDEPTSGLDFRHMEEVSNCLRELANQGKTIFVISHDFELIAKCCNFYLHIEGGKAMKQGPLNQHSLRDLQELFV